MNTAKRLEEIASLIKRSGEQMGAPDPELGLLHARLRQLRNSIERGRSVR